MYVASLYVAKVTLPRKLLKKVREYEDKAGYNVDYGYKKHESGEVYESNLLLKYGDNMANLYNGMWDYDPIEVDLRTPNFVAGVSINRNH